MIKLKEKGVLLPGQESGHEDEPKRSTSQEERMMVNIVWREDLGTSKRDTKAASTVAVRQRKAQLHIRDGAVFGKGPRDGFSKPSVQERVWSSDASIPAHVENLCNSSLYMQDWKYSIFIWRMVSEALAFRIGRTKTSRSVQVLKKNWHIRSEPKPIYIPEKSEWVLLNAGGGERPQMTRIRYWYYNLPVTISIFSYKSFHTNRALLEAHWPSTRK